MDQITDREKIKSMLSCITVDTIGNWCKHNKVHMKNVISSLDHLQLERDRHDRVQFRQAVWHHVTNTMQKPTCNAPGCNAPVKWNNTKHSYQQYCSNTCVHKAGLITAKRESTMIDRYGVSNYFLDVASTKQARLKKLGVEHAMQSQEIKQAAKQTNTQRYGASHPWKNKKVRRKCVDSRQYEFINKAIKQKLDDPNWLSTQLVDLCKTQHDVACELGVAQSTVGLYASKHNILSTHRSKIQQQILMWLQDACGDGVPIKSNDRTVIPPMELDIVLPHIKLAVEIDGVFWHGELNGKHRQYHINKTSTADKQGFDLIHIYDTEWYTQRDIVKSRLLSKIHKNKVVHARKCAIRQLHVNEYKPFFNETHIQGSVYGHVCYGLVSDGVIVAALLIGKTRFDKQCEFELLRYSSKLFTNVVGGASKLFKHFVKHHNPASVVSYCDVRWGRGQMYEKLGFHYDMLCPPNYMYFDRNNVGNTNTLFNRIKYQKHKLAKILPIFNPNLSEWDNMKANGYDRIWNCGNMKWIWKKPA